MGSSESPIDALIPYFENQAIKAESLLEAIRPSDMPLAYEALETLATRHQLPLVLEAIEAHQGMARDRQDELAREIIPEVKPVLEVSCTVEL